MDDDPGTPVEGSKSTDSISTTEAGDCADSQYGPVSPVHKEIGGAADSANTSMRVGLAGGGGVTVALIKMA
jgi:hypothetical protein